MLSRLSRFSARRAFYQSARASPAARSLASRQLRAFTAPAQQADLTKMFCMQCEQTEGQKGCTVLGVCGKTPEVAKLQDLLVHYVKGVSQYAHAARQVDPSAKDAEVDRFVLRCLFSTLTNVNFDAERMQEYLKEANIMRNTIKKIYEDACARAGVAVEQLDGPAQFEFVDEESVLLAQGEVEGVVQRAERTGDANLHGLIEMSMYGMKGASAYAEHAHVLGKESDEVYSGVHKILSTLTRSDLTVEEMLGVTLSVGELNVSVLALLDAGNTGNFGTPEPTTVTTTPVEGKCILVSGHDLQDLYHVLQQTEGKGINVYTHGEMLPAHSYPKLKAFSHLKGHYGQAWQLQKFDFRQFPGSILMTTNCLIEPGKRYKNRIFTRSVVGWPGVTHLEGDEPDYTPLIDAALAEDGFTPEDVEETPPSKDYLIGFGHEAVLSQADVIVDAVKSGAVKRFFVIGGCDGSEGERNYFTEVAKNTPQDSVILTLGCGKFRFNNLDHGTVGPLPRMLDMGQCNDSYSAVVVAMKLAEVFETDLNKLPLSFAVSWFEQKAVAVLLSLLHLGVQNIRLGPHLPAFVTPDLLDVLVDKFQIKPIGDAKEDVENMMKGC